MLWMGRHDEWNGTQPAQPVWILPNNEQNADILTYMNVMSWDTQCGMEMQKHRNVYSCIDNNMMCLQSAIFFTHRRQATIWNGTEKKRRTLLLLFVLSSHMQADMRPCVETLRLDMQYISTCTRVYRKNSNIMIITCFVLSFSLFYILFLYSYFFMH